MAPPASRGIAGRDCPSASFHFPDSGDPSKGRVPILTLLAAGDGQFFHPMMATECLLADFLTVG